MDYCIRRVDELSHHGIIGQKWGIRRFQYSDGSLTEEGKKRYGIREYFYDKKEKERRKVIEKGDPKTIQKHMNEFSDSELKEIQQRFTEIKKTCDAIDGVYKSNKANSKVGVFDTYNKRTDNMFKAIASTSKAGENAKKLYNTIVSGYNYFGGHSHPLWS